MPHATSRMRERRQELGIKLQDFAPRIGISYGHYRNVEYGNAPAAIEVFHRIARELAVPVADLIQKDNPRAPSVTRNTATGGPSTESTETGEATAEEAKAETRVRRSA